MTAFRMDIVFVGAGRLATQFSRALTARGHRVVAVFSRTMESATMLSHRVGGVATDSIEQLPRQADAFIISVKDDVLAQVIARLSKGREGCNMFHTAGSVPLSVFGALPHCGVIYPMQTFSKERDVDFANIPIYIEGSSEEALRTARCLAQSVSNRVELMDSDQRRYLHLAAVFACNFSNHCYALAAQLLECHGMTFDVMLPLIAETVSKVQAMHPLQAQTGPAVRYDENVLQAQAALLAGQLQLQRVYDLMSRSIHQSETERKDTIYDKL